MDKQGNFFKGKAKWVLRGFQDKQKEYQPTDSLASTGPRSARVGSSFALISRQDSLHGVNRDVVCQLPQKQVIFLELPQD